MGPNVMEILQVGLGGVNRNCGGDQSRMEKGLVAFRRFC